MLQIYFWRVTQLYLSRNTDQRICDYCFFLLSGLSNVYSCFFAISIIDVYIVKNYNIVIVIALAGWHGNTQLYKSVFVMLLAVTNIFS